MLPTLVLGACFEAYTCQTAALARDLVIVTCQEYGVHLPADDPDLRLELTDDDEPVIYCLECWEREFGE